MSKIPKKILRTYDQVKTPVLADGVVGITGDVVLDTESAATLFSKSRTESSAYDKHPAIIISSRKISISQIAETHRDAVIISLKGMETQQSNEEIDVIEHRALVAGYCDFIDPGNVIKELCPTVYELYLSEQESSLMVQDRACEVIMFTESYGIVDNVPMAQADFSEGVDEQGTVSARASFSGSNNFTNPAEKNEYNLKRVLERQPDVKKAEIFIVGDSIACNLTNAASTHGLVNQPNCRGKTIYFQCKTPTAKSGETTAQILLRLQSHMENRPKSNKSKKIMLVSAGTNDCLGYSGWGMHAVGKGHDRTPNKNFSVKQATSNIKKIHDIGVQAGYEVRFKKINVPFYGPSQQKGNEKYESYNNWGDKEKLQRYKNFSQAVNSYIVSNFQGAFSMQAGSGTFVSMYDHIHPNKAGSEQLLADALYDPTVLDQAEQALDSAANKVKDVASSVKDAALGLFGLGGD